MVNGMRQNHVWSMWQIKKCHVVIDWFSTVHIIVLDFITFTKQTIIISVAT